MGICFQAVGMAGGAISALILYKYPYLTLANYLVVILGIITCFLYDYAMRSANETLLLVSSSFMGIVMLPIFMIAYEMAVARTQPKGVGESMSCGIINTVACTSSGVFLLILTPILKQQTIEGTKTTMAILYCLLFGSFICLIISTFLNRKEQNCLKKGE